MRFISLSRNKLPSSISRIRSHRCNLVIYDVQLEIGRNYAILHRCTEESAIEYYPLPCTVTYIIRPESGVVDLIVPLTYAPFHRKV